MYNHPKVKAHLTFTHGEGFGRPLLEEKSFGGKPIIAPISTGQADFLDKIIRSGTTTYYDQGITKRISKRISKSESGWSTRNYIMSLNIMRDVYEKL